MAGSQSLKSAVQEVNRRGRKQMKQGWRVIHYVGLDSQEWVYSAGQKRWVQNVAVMMQLSKTEMCRVVLETVRNRKGQQTRRFT